MNRHCAAVRAGKARAAERSWSIDKAGSLRFTPPTPARRWNDRLPSASRVINALLAALVGVVIGIRLWVFPS